jgi:hypothetical protein
MKIKTRLIASAPNEEGIKTLIAKFFCGKPEDYRIGGNGSIDGVGLIWSKMPDGTERWLKSFRVVKKQGRFRFEAIIG